MARIFSGMQPSGVMHLGNYLGMVSQLLDLQKQNNEILCSIVDLHAITVWQNPKELHQNILNLTASLLASGIDANKIMLFLQSMVQEHTELTWILSCSARIGWLNRMIQFKEKAGKDKEKASVGLYLYPVLMAADILLYNAELVPVGEDQLQHIELARDVAIRFNTDYNIDFFTIPNPMIMKARRIMSLKDGTKKMSKSDPSDYGKILITDDNDLIAKKIMKAKTDSLPLPDTVEDLKNRPEINNLYNIYVLVAEQSINEVISQFAGKGTAVFKQSLVEILTNLINPIRIRYNELIKNPEYLSGILHMNAIKAQTIASVNVQKVKELVGFLI